jgi:hypothetical protein
MLISETKYPDDGFIGITVTPSVESEFSLKFRIPSWCHDAQLEINGKRTPVKLGADGYAFVKRGWNHRDRVGIRFKLEPRLVVGDHRNQGRVAIMYGPLVLAADSALLQPEEVPLNVLGLRGTNLLRRNLRRSLLRKI